MPAVVADGGCDFSRAVRTMSKALAVQAGQQPAKRKMFAVSR
jgi:hypothetical protein